MSVYTCHQTPTYDVGPGKVGFQVAKDRAQVDESDVIALDDPVRRIKADGVNGVGACAHQALVPVLAGTKLGCDQLKDLLINV